MLLYVLHNDKSNVTLLCALMVGTGNYPLPPLVHAAVASAMLCCAVRSGGRQSC